MAHPFTERFGKPSPPVATDIRFQRESYQQNWDGIVREVGAGWFMDRFLYLFGAGLQPLQACLDAWSFVVPPGKERLVIGRNAYGTLLVLEDPENKQAVYLLDPLRVVYWTHPNLELHVLVGREMPRDNLPHFFEDGLYREWVGTNGDLGDDQILAPTVPLSLGGQMDVGNFQAEEIVSYYESTAPIYAKAFATMAKARPAKKATPRKKK